MEKETGLEVTSPILLTPVEISKDTTQSLYKFKVPPVEDEVIVNPALLLKLKYETGIDLPQITEGEGLTPSSYIAKLSSIVEELGWRIEPSVHMGIFSFSKLTIYQDLTENLEHLTDHPIIRALSRIKEENLIHTGLPKIDSLDTVVDPGKTFQILDADNSQQLCIQYALRGQSFVMHGPPGTGKSQTIANIISEYIAAGKSVLFVSEKMAALEVVFNRLKEKNLDEYCLELHSYKANKREVINELNRTLTEHLKARRGITEAEVERLRYLRDHLNTYVDSIHQIRQPSSLSVYQILNEVAGLTGTKDIPSGYEHFEILNQETLYRMLENVRRLSNNWAVVEEGASFPWRGCKTVDFSVETRTKWLNLLSNFIESLQTLYSKANDYCGKMTLKIPKSLEEYESLQKLAHLISSTPYPPAKWLEDTDINKLRNETEEIKKQWTSYRLAKDEIKSRYDARFMAINRGKANRIEAAWRLVTEQLSKTDPEGTLLRRIGDLINYTQNTRKRISEWENLSEAISKELGLPSDPVTVNKSSKLVKLVELCESPVKPERTWFESTALEITREFIKKSWEENNRRDYLKNKIIDYTEEVTKLDLPQLIGYLEGPGSSPIRYLTPRFYRVRQEISKTHKRHKMPETVIEDLKIALELRELSKKIESEQTETEKRLGQYYRPYNSDYDGALKALKVAEEALHLVGSPKAPKALRDNISIGTKVSEQLRNNKNQLNQLIQGWRNETKELHGLLPDRLPGEGDKLAEAPLDKMRVWLIDLEKKLDELDEESRVALVTADTSYPETFKELISDLRKSEELNRFEEDEAMKAPNYRATYGGLYDGISTDWVRAIDAIEWAHELLKVLPEKSKEPIKIYVTDKGTKLPSLGIEGQLDKIYSSVEELNSRFDAPLWNCAKRAMSVDAALEVANRLSSRIDDLQTWTDFNETSHNLKEMGLEKFVSHAVSNMVERDTLVDLFNKSIYSGLLNYISEGDETLRRFRAVEQEQAVKDFRSLDTELIEKAPQKVIAAANTNKPQGVFLETQDSEISILLREAAKKRRQMPLRQLFDKIPHLIRRLKPCLLMSPISVSQFLIPERIHFDLVVFDEASQIYTEDAVGSIYRGDALVVAGDNKQLPPTPFFQYVADSDDVWDEMSDETDVFDSVLDECTSIGLPVHMLKWHYRSRHDSLIAFSNNEFYNGKLILFPSAIHRGSELGIEFVYVPDGVYDRGGMRNNTREAQVVADLVFKQIKEHPTKTLGVVTFSISQMNEVEDRIEDLLAQVNESERLMNADRLKGFFVKNLENVQGDERDLMIISVGYGYDKNGVMTMNFGPLNKMGGEKRLNVAITRAREKVILVSSIKSSDIDLNSTNSIGTRCLHDYISYAETENKPEYALKNEVKDLKIIEKDIAEEVRRLGYVVEHHVGESSLKVDMAVKVMEDPNRYLLGILLDGEYYNQIATARDRERLRVQVLESMGWTIHRIWSPDWVHRRSTEVERLHEALKRVEEMQRRTEKPIKKKNNENRRVIEHDVVTETKVDELPGSNFYKRASLETSQRLDLIPRTQRDLLLRLYRIELKHLLPKLVKAEGPIHLGFAYKTLNTALNLKRSSPLTFAIFLEEVDKMAQSGRFQRQENFLWPDGIRTIKARLPGKGVEAVARPIEYLPPEEIQAAMLNILDHSIGLTMDALIKETLSLFKIKSEPKTNNILTNVITRMLKQKTIQQIDNTISRTNLI